MCSIRTILLSVAAVLVTLLPASAATPVAETDSAAASRRPIMAIYSLEIGGARDLSTYLSPLYYTGLDLALSGSWTKDFNHWSDRCVMRFEAMLDFQSMLNPSKNARMYGATGRFGWGLAWSRKFARDWRVTVGPMLDIYGGALYLSRNGNNPVTALASVGLDVQASLRWRGRLGRLPVEVADEVRIPTLSAFFCPEYGESYYEIYLGNRRGLAHCGWWGNAFGIDNLVSLRMNFGKTGMMVGYRLDMRRFNANHLDTQIVRNAFVIGVIPYGW